MSNLELNALAVAVNCDRGQRSALLAMAQVTRRTGEVIPWERIHHAPTHARLKLVEWGLLYQHNQPVLGYVLTPLGIRVAARLRELS